MHIGVWWGSLKETAKLTGRSGVDGRIILNGC
jgi:hypothetical protein